MYRHWRRPLGAKVAPLLGDAVAGGGPNVRAICATAARNSAEGCAG